MPDTGSRPTTRAEVDRGLADDPRGRHRPRAACRSDRARCARRGTRRARTRRTARAPAGTRSRPSSSPMIAKMKSVCAFGQEHPLGPARAEADAVDAAAPERDQRLRDLVAGVRRVGPRVEEREHARAAIRRGDGEHRRDGRPRATERRQVLDPRAGDEQQRDRRSARTRSSSRGRARGSRGTHSTPQTEQHRAPRTPVGEAIRRAE